ncbi:unnamed protein product [Brassica oleracea var. botrytis]|uniref:(rape) hypothetical protein n=1 Tax=Brassica napus TaxID=3708 RepID=A0A816IYX4_BRANA|nr:unnamed protein product [Brassica napus]
MLLMLMWLEYLLTPKRQELVLERFTSSGSIPSTYISMVMELAPIQVRRIGRGGRVSKPDKSQSLAKGFATNFTELAIQIGHKEVMIFGFTEECSITFRSDEANVTSEFHRNSQVLLH